MEHLRAAGIPCADLTPLPLDVRTDFLPADGHWSARGHRKAAEALRPFLLGALPASRRESPGGPPRSSIDQ